MKAQMKLSVITLAILASACGGEIVGPDYRPEPESPAMCCRDVEPWGQCVAECTHKPDVSPDGGLMCPMALPVPVCP